MKLDIGTLPNVDDVPGKFQARMNWIRNNEPLNGASTRYGHEGELNRAPVQLQENIVYLHGELDVVAGFANHLYDDIESIKDSLELGTDVDAITQVYRNRDDIIKINKTIDEHEVEISDLIQGQGFIKDDIGIYDPLVDPKYRTLRGNIVFIKKEMGAYPGQDMNGQPSEGALGSGMKHRIITNSDAIAKVTTRVNELEDKFVDSDVGALSGRVDKLRTEIGPESMATDQSIYVRFNKTDLDLGTVKETQGRISTAIDLQNPTPISSRVRTLETRTLAIDATVNTSGTGLVDRVGSIEYSIGTSSDPLSLEGRMASLQSQQDDINSVVGADSSSGMRGQIAWVQQKIGPDDGSDTASIEGRLKVITETQNVHESSIQDLQSEMGNGTSGLKGDVNTLKKTMYGDSLATDPIDKNGIRSTVVQINENYTEDVIDIDTYVRTKDQWIKKSMSIAKFGVKDNTVNLSDTVSNHTHVFGSELIASTFNNRIARVNDDIVVDDQAVYRISVRAEIPSANASGFYSIGMNINDTASGGTSYGVKTVDGRQILSFEFTGLIELQSRLKFFIKGENTAGQATISISDMAININPVL